MIAITTHEAFSTEWVRTHITNIIHALVILRCVIPWERIERRLTPYYQKTKGRKGKPIRMMVALLLAAKWYGWSDRQVVEHVKENQSRYTLIIEREIVGVFYMIDPGI